MRKIGYRRKTRMLCALIPSSSLSLFFIATEIQTMSGEFIDTKDGVLSHKQQLNSLIDLRILYP